MEERPENSPECSGFFKMSSTRIQLGDRERYSNNEDFISLKLSEMRNLVQIKHDLEKRKKCDVFYIPCCKNSYQLHILSVM